ncbi:hypothetical protein C4M83_06595, partial [Mycoplasmopsis pullorum]
NLHFHTNIAYLDENRINRILNHDQGLNVTLDWTQLQTSGKIVQNGVTQNVVGIEIEYQISFELTAQGIKFKYQIINNDTYKVFG